MHFKKILVTACLLTLCLALTPACADTYSDVQPNQWYSDGVNFAIEQQLFKLDSSTEFGISQPVTRAEMVYALWMLEGQPQATSAQSFSDLTAEAYYNPAVQWAASVGVTSGLGNNQFGVSQYLNREQMVTFLFNLAKYQGHDVSVGENTNILSYDDFDQISEYAIGAFQWACGSGIINGTSASTLAPKDQLTKSQLSVILFQYHNSSDSGENTFNHGDASTIIELEGNATTGYSWQITQSDPELYTVKELEYVTSNTDPMIAGAGGTFRFEVTGQKPGTGTLTFTYYQSWMEPTATDQQAIFKITVADDGTVTAVQTNDTGENTFNHGDTSTIIELEGNATTGYSWQVTESNVDLYTVQELDYVSSDPDSIATGVGGTYRFKVTGQKPGTGTLTFTYYRSWEQPSSTDQKATFKITVADNGAVTATQI